MYMKPLKKKKKNPHNNPPIQMNSAWSEPSVEQAKLIIGLDSQFMYTF